MRGTRLGKPYNEYILRALGIVRDGLSPLIMRDLQARRPHDWRQQLEEIFAERVKRNQFDADNPGWDPYFVLKTILNSFLLDKIFKYTIGYPAIDYARELQEVRNRGSHLKKGESLSEDDAYRALDNAVLLMEAIGASLEAEDARALRREFRDAAPINRAGSFIPTLDDERYILKCPADLDEYDQSWRMTAEFFDSEDLVDGDEDREAFQRNPLTMVAALDASTREVLGYVDIYHFPDKELDEIINDQTGDPPFDPTKLLPYKQACRASRVYIATIIVRADLRRRFAACLVPALVYGMLEFLKRHQFVGVDQLTIYSVPVTREGEAVLKRLGFDYSHPVVLDRDGAPGKLYLRTITREQVVTEQAKWALRCENAITLEFD